MMTRRSDLNRLRRLKAKETKLLLSAGGDDLKTEHLGLVRSARERIELRLRRESTGPRCPRTKELFR